MMYLASKEMAGLKTKKELIFLNQLFFIAPMILVIVKQKHESLHALVLTIYSDLQ